MKSRRVQQILDEVQDWDFDRISYLYHLVTSGYRAPGEPMERMRSIGPAAWRDVLRLAPHLVELSVSELMDLGRGLLELVWERRGVI